MRLQEVPAGIKVEIHIKTTNAHAMKESAVAENQPLEGEVLLDPCYLDDRLIGLSNKDGIEFSLSWVVDNLAWKLTDVQITTVKVKGDPYYRVTTQEEAARDNRRGAFREFIGRDMRINRLNHDFEALTVELKDISATGFGFVTNKEIEIGENIALKFQYEELNELLRGKVVRIQENGRDFIYGCSITDEGKDLGRVMAQIQRHKQHEKMSIRRDDKKKNK